VKLRLKQPAEELIGGQKRPPETVAAFLQGRCAAETPAGDPNPPRRNPFQTLSTDYGQTLWVDLQNGCVDLR
jgi:hypothetical protein